MSDKELMSVLGGASINGAILNALVRVGTLLYDLGHALGSAIRRTRSGMYCK